MLDHMPQEVKDQKKAASKAIFTFIRNKLQGRDDSIPRATVQDLVKTCETNIMDVGRTVSSVVIQAIRMTLMRVRKSWQPQRQTLVLIKDELLKLMNTYSAASDSIHFVLEQWCSLEAKVKEIDSPLPILLLSDSMFYPLKPSCDIYPIAHSGERLEQLLAAIPIIEVKARAVVLNHGLNHIRCLGDENKLARTMKDLYRKLHVKYPSLKLYHLQPPISPSIRSKQYQVANANRISTMMAEAGFSSILHPDIPDSDFGGDRFHYSKRGCKRVADYIVSFVDRVD